MKSSRIRVSLLTSAAFGALLLAAPAGWAQQDAPPPAEPGGEQGAAPGEGAPQAAPGPVGGVEQYRFPGATLGRSFLVPRFSLQEIYDSNVGYAATNGASQSDAITALTGGLSLQWTTRDSTLGLDYASEGLIYGKQTQPNAVIQQMAVTEKLSLRRWRLLFGENFSYLPNSIFALGGLGYLGGGTAGLPGIGGVTGLSPFQSPTQTVVSPNVSQFSSASIFQAQYFISGSSSVTGSVVVGFLHFFGDNLLNTRSVTARVGYDKSFTPRDTLNFSYYATTFDSPSGIPGFTTHYVQAGYRRIVSGRLQFSVSAGPSISHFSPMTGQTTVPGGANAVAWSLSTSLNYAFRNGGLNAQYTHEVFGGSGYLIGAPGDQFSGGFSTRVSRVWKANLTAGYAHNGSFQQTTAGSPASSPAFNYWYAGGSLSRPLGHFSSLAFSYNASNQTANTTVCANGLACGQIALVQVVGVTYSWSTRPFKLE